ncbi:helix-turn-helix transcriptional regulator [Corynebacterium cystitidis]|uniref:Transcriptional regulator, AlpA family n=1 Tax=Corynebacterium cystitidis DSM 20524 TaxID=1121357 RepID=A0A1H9W3G6_9CORY|nr:helix-turn-helix domain-containing protein [Corynebacterium cystitidis]WJY83011.1 Helix-turn-helix domain protein [Corynebacterium cystitidis DSM 20524]SES28227.1 transcriptional regulator, AlpA family [Corynebacterium cystitidis DSM 20524]SNV64879.1 Predicted transcriptional regulator [Corynebacterium cystitidis]
MADQVEDEFLRVSEVARMLGIPDSTFRGWVASGTVSVPPHYQFGGVKRFRRSEVEKWVEESRVD